MNALAPTLQVASWLLPAAGMQATAAFPAPPHPKVLSDPQKLDFWGVRDPRRLIAMHSSRAQRGGAESPSSASAASEALRTGGQFCSSPSPQQPTNPHQCMAVPWPLKCSLQGPGGPFTGRKCSQDPHSYYWQYLGSASLLTTSGG